MKKIYLDNAATTPILDEVIDAMMTVMKTNFGNPSSTHSLGQEAKMILEENRRLIAQELHVLQLKLFLHLAVQKPII